MSTEQIDPVNTGAVDENDQKTPTSQGQAEPAVTANSEQATTEPDARESLIKQLMQDPVEEQPEETAEKEEPEAVDELDPVEEVAATDAKTTEPEAKPDEKPLETVDTDKRLSERTRKRIEELRGKAAFGDLITKTLVDAKITPDEFSRWTDLSARLKKGDPTAVTELIATAKAFGYAEPTVVKQAEKSVDDIASEIYKAEFEAEVNDLNISEPLARKQARKLAEARVKADKVESRVEQEQPKQRTQETPQPVNPIRQHAIQTIDTLEKDYRSKIPGYAKIEKQVAERLVAEYGKQDPITWVGGFENIVRDELRKAATPVQQKAPVKAVAGTQIRPKTEVASTPKTADDPRQALIKQLAGGAFARR